MVILNIVIFVIIDYNMLMLSLRYIFFLAENWKWGFQLAVTRLEKLTTWQLIKWDGCKN